MQVAPFLIPWGEVSLINSQSLRICLWDELGLTGNRPYVLRIFRLTETHIVITANGIAIGLEIDVGGDVEIHTATYILYYEAITPWCGGLEVNVPDIGTDKGFLASFLGGVGSRLPKLHSTHVLFLFGLYIIYIYLTTFPTAIVALATIAQPLIEVSGMNGLSR